MLFRSPRVFLLDEPLSNLDAKLRTSAREELDEFHQRIKTTTIYVTHDQVEAMALGDRIVVLHQGEIRQIGTPQEVYDDPADTFVATFLGSPPMNLLEADGVIVGFRPERFLPAGLIAPWAPVDEVNKTLRPENLLPADLHNAGDRIPLRLYVEHSEYLGSERVLYGKLAGTRFPDKPVCARVSSSVLESYKANTEYDFAVPEHELRFFDAKTGKRIPPRPFPWQ